MKHIFKLEGKVQEYTWGGFDYIPQLLQVNNSNKKPFAEYWLGAHPNHPSNVLRETGKESLLTIIKENTEQVLGEATATEFGTLPYLLKILDVRQMLSIQVHPSKEEAEKGYQKETEAGVPLTAPHRNYKDENHKPELMVALGPFWLLHGFKSEKQLMETLQNTPELKALEPIFQNKSYKGLYEYVMTLPQEEVNDLLAPLASRVLPLYDAGSLEKSSEDFWAARAIHTFCKEGNYDRGIFSIYFFNVLALEKGEGVFQPAGMPHAYLEGQNVEIMANSDNVLRAGLTDKHIDVAELLRHTQFSATVPQVIPSTSNETHYDAPVPEFGLYQYHLEGGHIKEITTKSAEIYLVLEEAAQLEGKAERIALAKGEAAIVYANTELKLHSGEKVTIFRASTGRA